MQENRLGIDIGGTKLLLIDRDHPMGKRLPTGPLFGIKDLQEILQKHLSTSAKKITSIGIAFPGLVQNGNEVVLCGDVPYLNGLKITDLKGLDVPIHFLNDTKAATKHAHLRYGGQTLVTVMVGTGLGMGIYVDGKPMDGAFGWAGELGSVVLPTENGPKSLDELSGGKGILESLALPINQIYERARLEDLTITKALESAGTFLGLGLAMVVNILNPDVLVLGGGTLNFPGYREAAVATMKAHTLGPLMAQCTLIFPTNAPLLVAEGARMPID